jgi:peptidylprolyl isomerase
MEVPPADGYGTQGNTQAGIKGTDTLVFVVDVIASYGKGGAATDAEPVTALPTTLPTVGGKLGERPTINVKKGLTPPKAANVTVLAKGTGPAVVTNRLAVVQFEAVSWANQAVGSTWTASTPQGAPVGAKGQAGPFDQLVGVPVGSRVLLELPAQQGADPSKKPNQAKDSLAVVIDVIAQHGPAKAKS